MSAPEEFNPYHKWLGIPLRQLPPDHYALLGLSRFESDPEVISIAADGRMMYLRSFQIGKHSELSQRLLNEISAARVTLLNPDQKREYDDRLKAETIPVSLPLRQAKAMPDTPDETFPDLHFSESTASAKKEDFSPIKLGMMLVVVVLCAAAIFFYIVIPAMNSESRKPSGEEEIATYVDGEEVPEVPGVTEEIHESSRDSGDAVSPKENAPKPTPKDMSKSTSKDMSKAVGHWTFENNVENMANSGFGNGTKHGGMYVAGRNGKAVSLNGASDYVSLGDPEEMRITGEITIIAWFKPQRGNGLRNIVAKGPSLDVRGEICLRISDDGYEVGSWDGGDYKAGFRIPQDDYDNWVHLAGIYDGTSWLLYRNGERVGESAAPVGALPVRTGWAIGADAEGKDRFFQGVIDEVRIYNRALTSQEIAELAGK